MLVCIDRFSKYPTVELFDKTNETNVVNVLGYLFQFHVLRNIRLDQARCLIRHKSKNFCKQNKINKITEPAIDHRATGLVKRFETNY